MHYSHLLFSLKVRYLCYLWRLLAISGIKKFGTLLCIDTHLIIKMEVCVDGYQWRTGKAWSWRVRVWTLQHHAPPIHHRTLGKIHDRRGSHEPVMVHPEGARRMAQEEGLLRSSPSLFLPSCHHLISFLFSIAFDQTPVINPLCYWQHQKCTGIYQSDQTRNRDAFKILNHLFFFLHRCVSIHTKSSLLIRN